MRLDDAANNPQRCWELWDLLLYDKVVSEPNITLLLETALYSATVKDGRDRRGGGALRQERAPLPHQRQDLLRLHRRFAPRPGSRRRDAHGPRSARRVRRIAGAREGRRTRRSARSILFTSRLYRNADAVHAAEVGAQRSRRSNCVHRKVGSRTGSTATGGSSGAANKDIIRDNERIRFELLSIVMGVWDYIKNSGDYPGSANWAMDWVGMMPGKRGSRRLVGDHMLTQQDLMQRQLRRRGRDRRLADGRSSAGRLRPPRSAAQHRRCAPPEVYDIPLRSLYSRNIANLMMAGRNISATDTCVHFGARDGDLRGHRPGGRNRRGAMCGEQAFSPRQLANDKKLISELRQSLLRDDQTIKNARNEDARDLARSAKVTASAEEPQATSVTAAGWRGAQHPRQEG